jgi:hypothetical protein
LVELEGRRAGERDLYPKKKAAIKRRIKENREFQTICNVHTSLRYIFILFEELICSGPGIQEPMDEEDGLR